MREQFMIEQPSTSLVKRFEEKSFTERISRLPRLEKIFRALAESDQDINRRKEHLARITGPKLEKTMGYLRTGMFDPAHKEIYIDIDGKPKKEAFHPLNEEQLTVLEGEVEKFKQSGQLEILDQSQGELRAAYALIRYHLLSEEPPEQNSVSGEEFREASAYITQRIFDRVIKDSKKSDLEKTILDDPWRGGCAFSITAQEAGIKHFAHTDVKRDEGTAEAEVKYESLPKIIDQKNPENNKNLKVIIADPMLATGGTMLYCVERYLKLGIREENITLAAVVTAPEGVFRLLDKYPKIKIITGAHDEKMNRNAYIEKGLGDFGDLYFRNLADSYVNELAKRKILTEDQAIVLLGRIYRSNEQLSEPAGS